MISEKNFHNMPVNEIPVDTEYQRCNFSRSQPQQQGQTRFGERLFPGDDTPRTFINCNLLNCETPPGSTVIGGTTAIIETMVEGPTDTLEVNGVVEHTTQYYDNIKYGKWNAETDSYDYDPSPITMPVDY